VKRPSARGNQSFDFPLQMGASLDHPNPSRGILIAPSVPPGKRVGGGRLSASAALIVLLSLLQGFSSEQRKTMSLTLQARQKAPGRRWPLPLRAKAAAIPLRPIRPSR